MIAQQELDGIPVDWQRLERLREQWEWQRLEALSAFDVALPGVLPMKRLQTPSSLRGSLHLLTVGKRYLYSPANLVCPWKPFAPSASFAWRTAQ